MTARDPKVTNSTERSSSSRKRWIWYFVALALIVCISGGIITIARQYSQWRLVEELKERGFQIRRVSEQSESGILPKTGTAADNDYVAIHDNASASDIWAVVELGRIASLSVGGSPAPAESFRCIDRLTGLRQLDVIDTAFDDTAMDLIGSCRDLEELVLYCTQITDRSLSVIAQLPRLSRLDITETATTEDAVRQVLERQPKLSLTWAQRPAQQKDLESVVTLRKAGAALLMVPVKSDVGQPGYMFGKWTRCRYGVICKTKSAWIPAAVEKLAAANLLHVLSIEGRWINHETLRELSEIEHVQKVRIRYTTLDFDWITEFLRRSGAKDIEIPRGNLTPEERQQIEAMFPVRTVLVL